MSDANYDPFSYGQVRLGGGAAPKGGTTASPEDMLFAGGSPPPAEGRDPSWDLMQSDMSGLLPESSSMNVDQFADEVLGNGSPLMSAPAPTAAPRPGGPRRPRSARAAST